MLMQEKLNSMVCFLDFLNQQAWSQNFILSSQRKQYLFDLMQLFTGEFRYFGFNFAEEDIRKGVRLFTGERVHTQLGINTILSLEIARQFHLLDGFSLETGEILSEIDQRLLSVCFVKDNCTLGECALGMLAFWRYLLVSGWPDREQRIQKFLDNLRKNRDGSGRWTQFPFYFSLVVLLETDLKQADDELFYALQACQRCKPYIALPEPYASRRLDVLNQVEMRLRQNQGKFSPLGI